MEQFNEIDDCFEEYDDFEIRDEEENTVTPDPGKDTGEPLDENGLPTRATDESLAKCRETCDYCIDKAKEDLREMRGQWEIAGLARTFLKYATYMEGFDHLLNYLYNAVGDMTGCVLEHPRLKLQLLRLHLLVVRRIEAQTWHDLSIADEIRSEIAALESNIKHADNGEFDKIKYSSSLRHDPVEWTARWEEVIDKADEIADERLAGTPRGMGFCFAYWHERAAALRNFDIEWKNPHQMNPRVLFD